MKPINTSRPRVYFKKKRYLDGSDGLTIAVEGSEEGEVDDHGGRGEDPGVRAHVAEALLSPHRGGIEAVAARAGPSPHRLRERVSEDAAQEAGLLWLLQLLDV